MMQQRGAPLFVGLIARIVFSSEASVKAWRGLNDEEAADQKRGRDVRCFLLRFPLSGLVKFKESSLRI